MKITSGTVAAVIAGIICILLTASLIGITINYNSTIDEKDSELMLKDAIIGNLTAQVTAKDLQISENENTISTLNNTIADQGSQIQALTTQNNELQTWLDGNTSTLNAQIATLQNQTTALKSQVGSLQDQASSLGSQITILQNQTFSDQAKIDNLQSQAMNATRQIDSLNSTVIGLQNQREDLVSIINMSKTQLSTLVFHVCEKGDEYTWRLPDVNGTYNQILALSNNTYNVLLLPEYKSHSNWTEELSWLAGNFGGKKGIPIMLDVFASTEGSNPVTKLSTVNISQAMAVCNVKYVRIFETISWYIEHEQPFPADYVKSLLEFCRSNGLKVFWSEWKADGPPDNRTFTTIQNIVSGYEDIVTVSFGTNSRDEQPPDGFLELHPTFQHWGASVQAWYYTTYYNADPVCMPAPLLVQHALSAKQIGAEIIQFEPYWYFFDDGRANDNLRLLLTMLCYNT